MSILLYGCTTWMLTKRIEKKLDSNCKRMLQAILNKSWKQHPTKQLLYSHLPPISKTTQVKRTRHKDELISNADEWVLVDQQELIYSSSVRTQDVVSKTCWKRWTTGMNGKRELGKSVLVAQYDDILWRLHASVTEIVTTINATVIYIILSIII